MQTTETESDRVVEDQSPYTAISAEAWRRWMVVERGALELVEFWKEQEEKCK